MQAFRAFGMVCSHIMSAAGRMGNIGGAHDDLLQEFVHSFDAVVFFTGFDRKT